MHGLVERLERLMTLLVLLVLGMAMTQGLLEHLDWRGVAVALALVLVVRPLAGYVALAAAGPRRGRLDGGLDRGEMAAVAFFGVRGVGSLLLPGLRRRATSTCPASRGCGRRSPSP